MLRRNQSHFQALASDWEGKHSNFYKLYSYRCRSIVPGDSRSAPQPAASNAKKPILDESKPQTSLQLRLMDGSRVVAQLNLHHTVGELRAYINSVRPSGNTRYALQTQFPTQNLDDDGKTLDQYGLKNAVIFQRPA
jgi:hypothetical protein